MNISLVCACFGLFLILSIYATNDNKYKALQKEYDNYRYETESRINILVDEIEILQERNEELSKEEVSEILYYLEPFKETNKEIYIKQYKEIIEKYRLEGMSVYDIYTEEELNLIYRCVETEVYQAPIDAKINVTNVIFNRLKDGRFGKDICSIITAPNQFAYHRTVISESTILAVEYAFCNPDTTNGAIAFRSDISPETWGGWKKCHYDGFHSFYCR